jgi:hypothetical protein
MRDENQLHAAVVELVTHDDAEIKYSTVQNWYPGDAEGKGGIYNFVTKRGDCRGKRSKISWTQVETGSAITWKYPSCILRGDGSRGEFYSIAISNGMQQVDSGTKMIHLGKNTTSRIISKGISAGRSQNTYRGLVTAHRKATGARNFTNCDSLLVGDKCGAHTVPYLEAKNSSTVFEHEATTSKISEDMLFYCRQRGLSAEEATRCGQRLRQGRAAATADGIRGRSPKADFDLARRKRGMSTDQFRTAATACLGANKPAGDLVDCIAEHFPEVEAFRENDDLIVKGGGRFLVVRRDGPDTFRVTDNVAVPSTNTVDEGGGTKRTLNELIDDIVTLDD